MSRTVHSFILMFFVIASTVPANAGGGISGTVKYEGKIPKMKKFDMVIEGICVKKHLDDPARYPSRSEALILGDGNTMGNIFVRVISGLPDKEWPVPEEPVILDQDGCQYKPHVLALMVEQPLLFKNSDGILHNLHTLPEENDEFNVTMPKFLKETTRTFEYAESMFRIKCDVHPWMGGYVAVMDHPFFDVTEPDGMYNISGLEPGTYTIEAWHEKLGTQTAEVTIGEGETTSINFTFSR